MDGDNGNENHEGSAFVLDCGVAMDGYNDAGTVSVLGDEKCEGRYVTFDSGDGVDGDKNAGSGVRKPRGMARQL